MSRLKKFASLLTAAVFAVACTNQDHHAAKDDFASFPDKKVDTSRPAKTETLPGTAPTSQSGSTGLVKVGGGPITLTNANTQVPNAPPIAVLATVVPSDALFYIGWQGAENLKGAYANSNLKKVIDASEIPAWVSEKTEWLMEKIKKEEPEAEGPVRIALSISAKVWQHPTALYFGPMDFSKMTEETPPDVRVALVCQAGADADALVAEIKPLIAQAEKEAPKDAPPMRIVKIGDRVVFAVGKFTADQEAALGLVPGKTGPVLNSNPTFRAAISQVDANAAVTFYLDVPPISAQLKELFTKVPDADAKKFGPLVIDALGVDGFTQVAITGGFSGKEWTDRGFIGLTGEKKGLGVFFDATPVTDEYLKMVPKDAVSFQTIQIDLAKIFDELRAGVQKVDPSAIRDFDQATVTMFKRNFDLDLRQDVLGPLGAQWMLYKLPQSEVTESGFVLLADLRDEKKFNDTLKSIEELLRDRGVPLAEEREKIAGVEAQTIALASGAQIAWGVFKGKFIISTSDGFEQAIKQMKAAKTSILDNPKFIELRKSFPQVTPVTVDFHDPAAIYPEFARMIAPLLLMANLYGAELPPNFLPDPDKVEKFLTPGGGIGWLDEKGYHAISRSAFPGATFITGGGKGDALALLPQLQPLRTVLQKMSW